MPPAKEVVQHDVQVERFRATDFRELEAWAEEAGLSPDELASQIVGLATRFISMRGKPKSNNVVPFAAPR